MNTRTLPTRPVTAAEIPHEWTDMIRGMLSAQGQPRRGLGIQPTIEIQSLSSRQWHPLALPAGGTLFTSFSERDVVLARLGK